MILNSLIIFGCSQENDTENKFLVTNAQVVDGTGTSPRLISVRIDGERSEAQSSKYSYHPQYRISGRPDLHHDGICGR